MSQAQTQKTKKGQSEKPNKTPKRSNRNPPSNSPSTAKPSHENLHNQPAYLDSVVDDIRRQELQAHENLHVQNTYGANNDVDHLGVAEFGQASTSSNDSVASDSSNAEGSETADGATEEADQSQEETSQAEDDSETEEGEQSTDETSEENTTDEQGDAGDSAEEGNAENTDAGPDFGLIDFELAEHERWAGSFGDVGTAGSDQRAEFLLDQAGQGATAGATGALTMGFAMGAIGGAIGSLAGKRLATLAVSRGATVTPVPGLGPAIGGVMAVAGLAMRDWGATADTIGRFGEGEGYEGLANNLEAVAEVLDVATQVMDVLGGVLGGIAVGMWVAAVVSAGTLSPLAASLSAIATGISLASTAISLLISIVIRPVVVALRALHTFESQGDPQQIETEGQQLQAASAQISGAVVGAGAGRLGGAAGTRGGVRADAAVTRWQASRTGGAPAMNATASGPTLHVEMPEAPSTSPSTIAGSPVTAATGSALRPASTDGPRARSSGGDGNDGVNAIPLRDDADFSDLNDVVADLNTSPDVARALTDTRPALQPRAQPWTRRSARRYANRQAAQHRQQAGMTGAEVQAGHTAAARHARESGISESDWDTQPMMPLHSRRNRGLDVSVTDANGRTRRRTRHTAQEMVINDAVERSRQANGGVLTPQGQLDAAEYTRWMAENTPWAQNNVDTVMNSPRANADAGPAVDPDTGIVIPGSSSGPSASSPTRARPDSSTGHERIADGVESTGNIDRDIAIQYQQSINRAEQQLARLRQRQNSNPNEQRAQQIARLEAEVQASQSVLDSVQPSQNRSDSTPAPSTTPSIPPHTETVRTTSRADAMRQYQAQVAADPGRESGVWRGEDGTYYVMQGDGGSVAPPSTSGRVELVYHSHPTQNDAGMRGLVTQPSQANGDFGVLQHQHGQGPVGRRQQSELHFPTYSQDGSHSGYGATQFRYDPTHPLPIQVTTTTPGGRPSTQRYASFADFEARTGIRAGGNTPAESSAARVAADTRLQADAAGARQRIDAGSELIASQTSIPTARSGMRVGAEEGRQAVQESAATSATQAATAEDNRRPQLGPAYTTSVEGMSGEGLQPGDSVDIPINPAYPEPPGTTAELALLSARIADTQVVQEAQEQTQSAMQAQAQEEQVYAQGLTESEGVAEGLVTGRTSHQGTVSDTETTNSEQQTTASDAQSSLGQSAEHAAALTTLVGSLRVFQGLAHLFSYLPGDLGDKAEQSKEDAGDLITSLNRVGETDEVSESVTAGEETMAANQERIETVATQGEETDVELTQNQEQIATLQQENASSLEQTQSVQQQAVTEGRQARNEETQAQKTHDTLEAQLQVWAAEHRQTRENAIDQALSQYEQLGYNVSEVN